MFFTEYVLFTEDKADSVKYSDMFNEYKLWAYEAGIRKLLTKKGTGKGNEQKIDIQERFIKGCVNKQMAKKDADELWQKFEYFSGYGFNKSHAVSYSILSYQCAWLLNYFPECWMAAFLDKEPESRKEAAISLAQKMGFYIESININLTEEVLDKINIIHNNNPSPSP